MHQHPANGANDGGRCPSSGEDPAPVAQELQRTLTHITCQAGRAAGHPSHAARGAALFQPSADLNF